MSAIRRLGRSLAAHRWLAVVLGLAIGLRVAVGIAYRPALFGALYLAVCARPTSPALLASGALLAAATTMRLSGLFAFPAWLLYLTWKRIGWRPLLVGIVSFAIPLLVYAGLQGHATGRFGLTEGNGWFLYGRIGEIAAPCGDAKI